MTTAHEYGPTPVPQPPARPEELRAALAQLNPGRIAEFDSDRAKATDRARSGVSAAPLRTFAEAWAIEVAIERHPATAAHLRELEGHAATTADITTARSIAAEISRIRGAAATEAGIRAVAEGAAQ
ncbi:hypothetical protein O3Q52_14365 [Streptomyces sp. ActVer]|uniref:hypothetical protein n=1 Tax=Streptomyces sp. ActVer TaxID=3014558 RepID=UPI0022B4ADCD|nr:hypothetical protein [Streptomyces sp. ActVer]MCZ4509360.1 hypothetical protein [Streptomyces sp. ActVer]